MALPTWGRTWNRGTAPLLLTGVLAIPADQLATPAKAKEIYQARCAKCHGPDGHAPQKGEGLSFADGEWNHGSDLKSIVGVITDGVPDTGMNPFKDQLSAAEI